MAILTLPDGNAPLQLKYVYS